MENIFVSSNNIHVYFKRFCVGVKYLQSKWHIFNGLDFFLNGDKWSMLSIKFTILRKKRDWTWIWKRIFPDNSHWAFWITNPTYGFTRQQGWPKATILFKNKQEKHTFGLLDEFWNLRKFYFLICPCLTKNIFHLPSFYVQHNNHRILLIFEQLFSKLVNGKKCQRLTQQNYSHL